MENENKASILEMARGAIMEQVDVEVSRIVDNIVDVNTDPKKKRQLVLTIDFTPSADRSIVSISANAKCKLQPCNAIQTSLFVGVDGRTGEVIATEMTPNIEGQLDFDGGEEPAHPILKMVSGGK